MTRRQHPPSPAPSPPPLPPLPPPQQQARSDKAQYAQSAAADDKGGGGMGILYRMSSVTFVLNICGFKTDTTPEVRPVLSESS